MEDQNIDLKKKNKSLLVENASLSSSLQSRPTHEVLDHSIFFAIFN